MITIGVYASVLERAKDKAAATAGAVLDAALKYEPVQALQLRTLKSA